MNKFDLFGNKNIGTSPFHDGGRYHIETSPLKGLMTFLFSGFLKIFAHYTPAYIKFHIPLIINSGENT